MIRMPWTATLPPEHVLYDVVIGDRIYECNGGQYHGVLYFVVDSSHPLGCHPTMDGAQDAMKRDITWLEEAIEAYPDDHDFITRCRAAMRSLRIVEARPKPNQDRRSDNGSEEQVNRHTAE